MTTEMKVITPDVPLFQDLSIQGGCQVSCKIGDENKIRIFAPASLVSQIQIEHRSRELLIVVPDQRASGERIKIEVRCRPIRSVHLEGAITARIDVGSCMDVFDVIAVGSHASVSLCGVVEKAFLEGEGGAHIDALELMAQFVNIDLTNGSDALVHASRELRARVLTECELHVDGNPVIRQVTTGPFAHFRRITEASEHETAARHAV